MTHVEDVLLWAIAQKGDKYVFGAEVPLTAQDGDKWDCSELVQWSCGKAGVAPAVPDGAFNQWAQIKQANGLISVPDGINTRGALLFAGDGTGSGRDAIFHVAFSLGDGTTIEARGSKWGVGCWTSVGRFNFAGRIGGLDYSKDVKPLTPPPAAAVPAFPGLTKPGASGDAVRQVQQRLRDRGWNVSVDGVFGPATEKLVRAFQQDKHLEDDGIVGPKTWEALWRAPIT
jgi:cell wall-associated NlpC family hydrolase